MLARYTVEFALPTHQHPPNSQHRTDDPVALKEFLSELLERGMKIAAIHHDGVDLPSAQFDLLVKDAARMLAARRICHSLGINTDEERYRFGFSA